MTMSTPPPTLRPPPSPLTCVPLLEWCTFVKALQLPRPLGWLLTSSTLLPQALRLLLKAGSPVAPVGHALTRLTLSPNALVGAVKGNVVPGLCTVGGC